MSASAGSGDVGTVESVESVEAIEPVEALDRLDRGQLHVFVAGPGVGEGVAVALPGQGWLLVDGCRVDAARRGTDLPLRAVYERWRAPEADPVRWMVLTHPHEDHAAGFAELMDALDPEHVGLMGVGEPGPRTILDPLRQRGALDGMRDRDLRRRQVYAAARAVETRLAAGGSVRGLCDGVELESTPGVRVRAPEADAARALLARGWGRLRDSANLLSLVLELAIGASRVVLGSDLPVRSRPGAAEASTGWGSVLARHPQLGRATALKVPHHGSAEAFDARLVPAGSGPAWVTPFASQRLPRPEAGGGLGDRLEAGAEVRLTGLPVGRADQRARCAPARLTRDAYAAELASTGGEGFLEGAEDIRPVDGLGPLDPLWVARFDDQGRVTGEWRGRTALQLAP